MNPAIFIGEPLHYKHNIKIYPPKVKDVVANPRYNQYISFFTTSQEDIWDMIAEKEGDIPKDAPTPFELMLINCNSSKMIMEIAEEAFEFFTHEKVSIRPEGKLVLFMDGFEDIKEISELRILEEDDFFTFQNLIRQVIGDKIKEAPIKDENPHVALIKAKGRRRDRLVRKKGNSSSISLTTMLAAILCMRVGVDLLSIGEIPYPALSVLFAMGQDKEKYQVDIQLIAGGADAKKIKPKNWIRNIE